MAFTNTITETISVGGTNITQSTSATGDVRTSVSVVVPDATTDQVVEMTIDVTDVKMVYMKSDQALTAETNNATTPLDTITLTANIPYVWYTNKEDALTIANDFTNLYLTNASGAAATFVCEFLTDSTP